ncbi:Putative flippase GtrA (transmembrane translocase of bactoprenol-linked glucose) [Prauserella marina]|uniref:Putative flippase GtrA (Transmembrane translocase of bactoprenol-linked glucose) n=1 Tax=Prauserella marina TaxID=530584 RepID=A0A1G6VFW4_9PSEU|nr:GtrA family protein [Prauserella marina]PWV80352.1 putative flippase GtrA [Prauserella marina]SDD52434.1 Putative flippase GtrA (transmembrane translocase of bactoprenol-linked glucose) [Prauserella marina]
MSSVPLALVRASEAFRAAVAQHREFLRFALVGGTTWIIDTGIVYALKLTVLGEKPLTARVIGVVVATVVSYLLNREWSFRTRGGRKRPAEIALFVLCSAIGVGLTVLPQAISLYVLDLRVPSVSPLVQAVANFVTGQILGVLLAMFFRFWAFRRVVFPDAGARG